MRRSTSPPFDQLRAGFLAHKTREKSGTQIMINGFEEVYIEKGGRLERKFPQRIVQAAWRRATGRAAVVAASAGGVERKRHAHQITARRSSRGAGEGVPGRVPAAERPAQMLRELFCG